jgi:hypothetical protein
MSTFGYTTKTPFLIQHGKPIQQATNTYFTLNQIRELWRTIALTHSQQE